MISVNDHLYDIGIPVILWRDVDGLDGYVTKEVHRREYDPKTGKERTKIIKGPRFSKRRTFGNPIDSIHQIVIHHSGADRSTPKIMHDVLYNQRGLSVHFAVEDDGRIWQFNDVKNCCWHAGRHNPISVGIECCLFPFVDENTRYYDEEGRKKHGNLPHEVSKEIIHGREMKVYCFPHPQWMALARLCAGIWVAVGQERTMRFTDEFGKAPIFPVDYNGGIPMTVLPEPTKHQGMLGHLHCTKTKVDPSGFPWLEFEAEVGRLYPQLKEQLCAH